MRKAFVLLGLVAALGCATASAEIKATVLSDVFAGRVLHADQTVRAVARVSRPPFETPTIDIERIDE